MLIEDWRSYIEKSRKIPWDSILKSWLHKPCVVNYSRHAQYLPGRIAEYIKEKRKKRMKWFFSLLNT